MLKRIKYVSQFARILGSDDVIKLVKDAAVKNKKLDITGVLVASGDLFFQVIEGPAEAVDRLYESIKKDKRHKNVFTLEEGTAKTRLFPKWSMKKLDLGPSAETRMEPLRLLLDVMGEQKLQLTQMSDAMARLLWQEVVTAKPQD